MFQSFLNPISTGWNSANEEYNKVFHPNDSSKTNQDSLAKIAVGVGAGLGVGVGIIALAPVIGVSVGGALGIGAVCLTTTAIGAGIGVAIGFIPKEAEKSMRTPSASQDRSPDSPRSQESAENAQAYTADNFSNQIKENFKSLADLLTGNGNTNASPENSESRNSPTALNILHSSGQPASSPQATNKDNPAGNHNTTQKPDDTKNGPDNGGAGGISTQDSQQATASTITNDSKVAGAGTERLQATPNKEDATYKPPVAESSPSPPTQVREDDIKTVEQKKTGAALPAVDAGGSSSLQGSHQAPQPTTTQEREVAVAVELSARGPTAKLAVENKSLQNSVAPEDPPRPDNTQAASSPSTQGGVTQASSDATSHVAAVVSNKQPIIEFKSGSDKQPSSSPITSKGLGASKDSSNSSCWPVLFGSSRA